ncbi:MAG: shikimate kinase [Candidatus Omnitrophica bacterium]|nr:shikimate kinase [Candidatus Omnitrophota bacterium]MBU4479271.1 shikimate kinase [Candidatus Omnitrophota bacterium]MCG2703252.1 shikimate kinase [Candidatus Omnitrophota bacterium]
MRNIALVGFMGTGKTTIARNLAQRLDTEYVDLDALIEQKEQMEIINIFKEKGEPYFRKIEKEVVREMASRQGLIIACGGGVVLDEENIRNLKENGVIICLSARPEIIIERTKAYSHRPLLNVSGPQARIQELLRLRAPFYRRADYTVDTSDLSVEEVTAKILDWINNVGQA